jgi:hypothetical protein
MSYEVVTLPAIARENMLIAYSGKSVMLLRAPAGADVSVRLPGGDAVPLRQGARAVADSIFQSFQLTNRAAGPYDTITLLVATDLWLYEDGPPRLEPHECIPLNAFVDGWGTELISPASSRDSAVSGDFQHYRTRVLRLHLFGYAPGYPAEVPVLDVSIVGDQSQLIAHVAVTPQGAALENGTDGWVSPDPASTVWVWANGGGAAHTIALTGYALVRWERIP